MAEHWNAIRKHWQLLGPPLRPPREVVAAYNHELDLARSHVVMFSVTPELTGSGASMTAVDESGDMIAGIWPGSYGLAERCPLLVLRSPRRRE